jgi:hypothetical protein
MILIYVNLLAPTLAIMAMEFTEQDLQVTVKRKA